MDREAIEEAIEVLEDASAEMLAETGDENYYGEAITALRQALETEQEPVAHIDHRIHGWPDCFVIRADPPHTSPLYLSLPKREWVGLTDEQVEDEWERITGHSIFGGDRSEGRAMYISPDEVIEFSRAIEAKLKEKNT